MRRASDVRHEATGPDCLERRPQQRHLLAPQGLDVSQGAPPASLGPAPQGTEPRARDVDQNPIKRCGCPGRCDAVGDRDVGCVGDGVADQSGAMRLAFDGEQPRAAPGSKARQQCGLATGAGTHVEPSRVAALDGRGSKSERDQLAAFVLDTRAPFANRGKSGGSPAVEDRGRGCPSAGSRAEAN